MARLMTFRLKSCVAAGVVLLSCLAITSPTLAQTDDAAEIAFWESIRDTDSSAELKAYLDAYPNGKFAPLAKIRLKRLKGGDTKETGAQTSSPPDGKKEQKEKAESPEDSSPDAKPNDTATPKTAPKSGEKKETAAASESIPVPKEREYTVTLGAHPEDSSRPLLGVQISNLPDGFADEFGFAGRPGILVPSVTPAAAADKAGIRPGHVIVAMNGSPVPETARAFAQRVGTHKPGDELSIKVLELAPSPEALVESLKRRAESGGGNAASLLGYFYSQDGIVGKDETESAKWYRKAAEDGHPQAAYQLGRLYSDGRGVAKDEAEAVKWYRKAADLGDTGAMFSLGWMYANGRGVAKDEAEAVRWYRKAAEKGLPAAMNNLGYMYRQGRGVGRDEAKAFEWSLAAALQGVPKAFRSVANDYFYGRGTQKNPGKALQWYRKSAEAGNAASMLTVGQFLAKGVGVEQDAASAADWTIRGLKAGDTKLMNDMLPKLEDMGKDFLRELQKRLKAEGHYTDDIDGIYGSGTKSAIEALVEKHASKRPQRQTASAGKQRSSDPLFGIRVAPVTDKVAEERGLSKPVGAMVRAETPENVLRAYGLFSKDVILRVNETDIASVDDLSRTLGRFSPGDVVTLSIQRSNPIAEFFKRFFEKSDERRFKEAKFVRRTLRIKLGDTKSLADIRRAGERGWLGVIVQPVTDDVAELLGMPEAAGTLVAKVTPGAPADKAGLKAADVILRVNETAIDSTRHFVRTVSALAPGTRAGLVVWRGEKKQNLLVTLGRFPQQSPGSGKNGVRIAAVAAGSAAAEKGLKAGDRILEIAAEAVGDKQAVAAKMKELIGNERRSALLLLSVEKGSRRFVTLPLKDVAREDQPLAALGLTLAAKTDSPNATDPSSLSRQPSIEPLEGLDDLGDLRTLD